MKALLFCNLILITLFTACKTDISGDNITPESSISEYLLFGRVGLGWGCNSPAIYKLQDGKLYADTSGIYCKTKETYTFKGSVLSDAQYQLAKDLSTSFPSDLTSQASQTFGCPGCADGGMIYIQKKASNGTLKTWLIDDSILTPDPAGIDKTFPVYLINYTQQITTILETL